MSSESEEEVSDVESDSVEEDPKTFQDLGVIPELCEACEKLKWKQPTKIQVESIPVALQNRDIIGLAETGSGKTGAFALPILQALLAKPHPFFALILTPTRELALQICGDIDALGSGLGVKCVAIVGGVKMKWQVEALRRKPHIVVGTPGRLMDHFLHVKGFHMKGLKYLVLDEADRVLDMNLETEVNCVLADIPKERRTFLFSATMTKKVKELQRACLQDPVKIEVSQALQTVKTLQEYYIFPPFCYKDIFLYHVLLETAGTNVLIFCKTCNNVRRLSLILHKLGMFPVTIHGEKSQKDRLAALTKFKEKSRNILIATEVASRGLDIRHIGFVINFDLPRSVESYIHRVGRTARAGRAGRALNVVTQYDVAVFQWLERKMGGKKQPLYVTEWDAVLQHKDRVMQAANEAKSELRELDKEKKRKAKRKRHGDTSDEKQPAKKRKRFLN